MKLEEIEAAVDNNSIYTYDAKLLKECLRTIAALDVGGNPNYHARLTKLHVFISYLHSDLCNKRQTRINSTLAIIAICISGISSAYAVYASLGSSRWNETALVQIKSEISAVQKQEQKLFQILSSSRAHTLCEATKTKEPKGLDKTTKSK